MLTIVQLIRVYDICYQLYRLYIDLNRLVYLVSLLYVVFVPENQDQGIVLEIVTAFLTLSNDDQYKNGSNDRLVIRLYPVRIYFLAPLVFCNNKKLGLKEMKIDDRREWYL